MENQVQKYRHIGIVEGRDSENGKSRSGGSKRPPGDQRDCSWGLPVLHDKNIEGIERGLQHAARHPVYLGTREFAPNIIRTPLSVPYALSPGLAVFPQLSMMTNHLLVGTKMRHCFRYDDPTAQVCFSVILSPFCSLVNEPWNSFPFYSNEWKGIWR